MNPEELFEKFPNILLSNFRKRMLLGVVPADTVRQILGPLLSNFQDLMLELPPELRADFENILRLYPDVAEQFEVSINPPVVEFLRRLGQSRPKRGVAALPDGEELDMAAEPQTPFGTTKKSFIEPLIKDGQGFFTTDRGNCVYLEVSYSEEGDWVSFEYIPPRLDIEIHICGACAATLTPGSPNQRVPLESLSRILRKCAREVEIKIIELT
ncbi:MAG: hypothetical protein P4L43_17110 [Syntrophobacteraceae bacterium]|nr:hypothetical protein [Syntrophobacteraceae bacterium]